ncbi:hypothetical protein AB0M54_14210 [Actinoplanes sp. NPDC051470]|uniref:hypothetical protein n=1 Tax=Actinoplanes sp. NPDC051470 TaxID=3157224 RepID=UPI00342A46F8
MATSQTPNPHPRRIVDRAPDAPPDGDPTPPTETGDRTTIDALTPPAADDAPTVIVAPDEFRLPDVLKHIEAGKVVLVMPQHHTDD